MPRGPFVVSLSNHEQTCDAVSRWGRRRVGVDRFSPLLNPLPPRKGRISWNRRYKMQELLWEIFLIALLILLNGYLAGTDIAVVTARKSHVKQMAESGKRNAKIFLKLKEEPDRFLATIQIGITSVRVLASAVGGAAAVKVIKPALQKVPVKFISIGAEPIAIGIVVVM